MKRIILLITFVFVHINIPSAQWELVETLTAIDIADDFGLPPLVAVYDVESYVVEYPTTNIDGTPGMASGLITIPKSADFKFPRLIFQHGTVSSRDDVPSQLAGGYQLGIIFATMGYTVLQPDYLGLGINEGVHPYVHADSEAWVAVDMMRHVEENYEDNAPDRYVNDQIFISGYSQGGHAGMALHRSLELEFSDEYTVTAASHMSGPYSISESMIDFTLGDDEYGFSAYLASTTLSMKAAYPTMLADFEVEDIFKPEYADDVRLFEAEEIDLNELNLALETQLMADVGAIIPKEMVFPEIVEALHNDPSHPLSVALADNDVYDWAPQAPTRLMYCTADDQVTYRNAILADSVMNANGGFDVFAQQQGELLDHGGCVSPAVTTTIFFFLGFRNLQTSTDELIDSPLTQMSASQLENQLQVIIDPSILDLENPKFSLMDMNGKIVSTQAIQHDQFLHDLANLRTGLYIMTVSSQGRVVESGKVFLSF